MMNLGEQICNKLYLYIYPFKEKNWAQPMQEFLVKNGFQLIFSIHKFLK